MSEFRLEYLKRPELMARQFEVAVLPIGSTEPHAQHLVYGTDTFQVHHFARMAVEEANRRGATCLLLPTMPFSCNVNVHYCPWAMSLQPRTLTDFVTDVVNSVVRQGVKKIVLLNGHGGNTSVLQAALRELHPKTPAFVALAEWYAMIGDVEEEVMETEERGHACEMETSAMLYLFPEGVDMGAAEPTHSRPTSFPTRHLSFVRPWHAYTRNTGLGDPTKATAEKGRRMIEAAVDRLAVALKALSDAPYTEIFPFVED
jgi:creatinine amidohydrolase